MQSADERTTAFAAIVTRAIRERRLMRFVYGGHERLVEPHALGYRGGDLQLLAVQVGGGSERPGPIPQWKAFSIAKFVGTIDTLAPGAKFHDRSNYEGSFDSVIASV